MAKHNYMEVAIFAELYNTTKTTIYVRKNQGYLPKSIFVKTRGNKGLIDENYFARRRQLILDIKEKTQDLYELLSHHFTDQDIAKATMKHGNTTKVSVESIAVSLGHGLFSPIDDTKVITKVSPIQWKLYRYWWAIERRLRRRGTSIKEILNNREY